MKRDNLIPRYTEYSKEFVGGRNGNKRGRIRDANGGCPIGGFLAKAYLRTTDHRQVAGRQGLGGPMESPPGGR